VYRGLWKRRQAKATERSTPHPEGSATIRHWVAAGMSCGPSPAAIRSGAVRNTRGRRRRSSHASCVWYFPALGAAPLVHHGVWIFPAPAIFVTGAGAALTLRVGMFLGHRTSSSWQDSSNGAALLFASGRLCSVRYHFPVLGIEDQGSAAGRASPFWSSSTDCRSGERTNAMRPSRGGRLMVTPAFIRRPQVP